MSFFNKLLEAFSNLLVAFKWSSSKEAAVYRACALKIQFNMAAQFKHVCSSTGNNTFADFVIFLKRIVTEIQAVKLHLLICLHFRLEL